MYTGKELKEIILLNGKSVGLSFKEIGIDKKEYDEILNAKFIEKEYMFELMTRLDIYFIVDRTMDLNQLIKMKYLIMQEQIQKEMLSIFDKYQSLVNEVDKSRLLELSKKAADSIICKNKKL